jgi:hypothetical protein
MAHPVIGYRLYRTARLAKALVSGSVRVGVANCAAPKFSRQTLSGGHNDRKPTTDRSSRTHPGVPGRATLLQKEVAARVPVTRESHFDARRLDFS